ncbi:MAG: glutaredoxin domain-containing protein [Chloroflexota bacterium]
MNLNLFRRSPSAATASSGSHWVIEGDGELIVYGTAWCGDCHRSRRFLDRHGIPYRWIDLDADPASVARVLGINHGNRSVPTLLFSDGSTLTEPSDAELAKKLGIAR